jgi:hypothetical protein
MQKNFEEAACLLSKKHLDATVLEALDEGLKSILGESGKKIVYFHLQNSHGLRREEILEKPELLNECLNMLFGYGAKVIENAILKTLSFKLKIKYKEKNVKFAEYIKDITKKGKQFNNCLSTNAGP